jgi:hypothetical protein
MPSEKSHKIIGTTTRTAVAVGYSYLIAQEPEKAWKYGIGGSLGGYAMSRLADILEPAEKLGPNHRGLFHGVTFNGGVAIGSFKKLKELLDCLVTKAKDFDNRDEVFKAFLCRCAAGAILGGIGGHASHLLADSTTTKGLPLLS